VAFAADLVRIPTVNPPGSLYPECADFIADSLSGLGFAVERLEVPGHESYPRVNVIGSLGGTDGPCMHLNGHFDVVPPGDGWTVDPFGGTVRDGRLYGRGSADMKGGFAAAVFAAACFHRAGVPLHGTIEVSGTVDEESGGYAGVAHLAEIGRIGADRTDYVIIPEPFGPDRICVGHRGVYWGRIRARGRSAHGSMPFLGRSAIDDLAAALTAIRGRLAPEIGRRITAMPVVPPQARAASLNINSIAGGQSGHDAQNGTPVQTPCVADLAEAVFDRRFLVEEEFEDVREEIQHVLDHLTAEDPGRRYELSDLMVVQPTVAPEESPLLAALQDGIQVIRGCDPARVASPGSYDQKHFSQIGGVHHCVAYGPGQLEQAHQPDEWCGVDDMLDAACVMASAILDLMHGESA